MISIEEAKKLWTLVEPLKVCMMVTEENDEMHARPMQLVQSDFGGTFYFFADANSLKMKEINNQPEVCLTFSCEKSQTYVSATGIATISEDKALIDKYWNLFVEAWFPGGKGDPNVRLLVIQVFRAEHWNVTSNKVTQMFAYAKALITKTRPVLGEHGSATSSK